VFAGLGDRFGPDWEERKIQEYMDRDQQHGR
jgi:hypothetical protein